MAMQKGMCVWGEAWNSKSLFMRNAPVFEKPVSLWWGELIEKKREKEQSNRIERERTERGAGYCTAPLCSSRFE